jgi:hypothetical protein
MFWDWSTAGNKKNGKPYAEKGEFGKPTYHTKKGNFVWAKNVVPDYYWFNGSIEHLTVNDTIDPSKPVRINRPVGNRNDPNSRIFPFKVHRARQPYDKVNKNLVIPHLFPKGKDDKDAYWKGYDWNKAIAYGMEYSGLKYSGEFDFVETEYIFPITHMVAPKDNVVACTECHTRTDGRLAKLSGLYMPRRDRFKWLDIFGWIVVIGSLGGVTLHGLGRIFASNNRKER